jgi:hypothetical protein
MYAGVGTVTCCEHESWIPQIDMGSGVAPDRAHQCLGPRQRSLWIRTDCQDVSRSYAARTCCRVSVTNTSKSVPFRPSQHASH